MIYSHVAPLIPKSSDFAAGPAWAPDSPVCQDGAGLVVHCHFFFNPFLSFLGHVCST
jgi:hypothetical protein